MQNENSVCVGGDRTLSHAQFMETKRYMDLFQEALRLKYHNGGFSIMYSDKTGMCTVTGSRQSDTFKFPFEPEALKNHYCSFRINGDMDNFLAHARSQFGVEN